MSSDSTEMERQFYTLAESIPQLAWMADPDGHIFWYNRRWYDYTGTTFEQMEGWGWQSVHDPRELPKVLERWQASIATGRPFDMVFPLRGRDGVFRPFLTRVEPVLDDEGRVTRWIGTNTDITEVKRIEDQLRASEERLRLATDAAELGIWVWHVAEDRGAWENDRLYDLFGIPRTDEPINVGRFMTEFLHPEDVPELQRAIAATLATGVRYYFLGRFRRADGALRWIEFTGMRVTDAEGQPVQIIGTAADVTERKQAEEQVRRAAVEAARAAEANAKFRTLFEQGTQFAGILSLDGTVIEANRLSLEACGFAREEVIGRPFWECGWWNRSPELVEMVRGACLRAAAGQFFRRETPYYVADGARRWVDLSLAPVTDDAGRVLFLAPTGTDITVRKHAEAELREAARRKDEFLAMLAHELRNPLAPIRSAVETLRYDDPTGKRVARVRETINRQVRHMVRLVDDLLDVTRITRGKVSLRMERLDLAALVREYAEDHRPAAEAAGLHLDVETPQAPLWIAGDSTRLDQVVDNLVENALKFSEPGGTVRVSLGVDGPDAVLTVRDQGIGIEPGVLPLLFEVFTQADRTLDRSQGGLGLGLAIVKGLVDLHEGGIRVSSAGAGQGAEFEVRLPLRDELPALVPSAPVPEHTPVRKLRILIVEDNRDAADTLADLLRLFDYTVEVAYSGPDGVDAAFRFSPEVVLCDIGLPGLDGYGVARRLRGAAVTQQARLIAVTGYGSEEDHLRARQAGFDHHLVKPVDPEELLQHLRVSATLSG